jgi:hypothetical protein
MTLNRAAGQPPCHGITEPLAEGVGHDSQWPPTSSRPALRGEAPPFEIL